MIGIEKIFIKALDKLTSPESILALISLAIVFMLARTIARQLPIINQTLGRLTALVEKLVYDKANEDD